ncbi:MAG: hypothetical protein KME07_18915 [Pegethrix bostrychoides GSE-TBD4-15B]|uniref:Histidine kinase n=1 Tax=Pegethrix bostrychoides GSE-TBD4-15B TaxID=2839662 RepID=A0A951PDS9_9CYAN|nr:hypothetical protein [Pegethrix bostrychoides GSE-TBD4-15B]
MNNPVKQQISTDFHKVKAAGGQRLERISKILQDALSETMSELKAGGSEMRSIAKESSVVETLKTRPPAAPVEAKPVEVKIDSDDEVANIVVTPADISNDSAANTVETAALTDEQIAETVLEAVVSEAVLSEAVQSEVASVESSESSQSSQSVSASSAEPVAVQRLIDSINAAIDRIAAFVKDDKTQAAVQPYVNKLNAMLESLDGKISSRYGERYSSFKQEFNQDMGKAQVWYGEARANVSENGAGWVNQKQAELETKMGKAGATIAQKETKLKQTAKALWQTARKS